MSAAETLRRAFEAGEISLVDDGRGGILTIKRPDGTEGIYEISRAEARQWRAWLAERSGHG